VHRCPPSAHLISVLVVDDHPVMRWGVTAVLEESGVARVVGEAVDGFDAVRSVRELGPDVVVMDVGMPGMDGITATRQLRDACPATGVVLLTAEAGGGCVAAALAAGAQAVVPKGAPASTLVRAVQGAAGPTRPPP
jgi:DNA-binding NarL/FixJ family response regulator